MGPLHPTEPPYFAATIKVFDLFCLCGVASGDAACVLVHAILHKLTHPEDAMATQAKQIEDLKEMVAALATQVQAQTEQLQEAAKSAEDRYVGKSRLFPAKEGKKYDAQGSFMHRCPSCDDKYKLVACVYNMSTTGDNRGQISVFVPKSSDS